MAGLRYLSIVISQAKKDLANENSQAYIKGYLSSLLVQRNSLNTFFDSKNKAVREFSRGVEALVEKYTPKERLA